MPDIMLKDAVDMLRHEPEDFFESVYLICDLGNGETKSSGSQTAYIQEVRSSVGKFKVDDIDGIPLVIHFDKSGHDLCEKAKYAFDAYYVPGIEGKDVSFSLPQFDGPAICITDTSTHKAFSYGSQSKGGCCLATNLGTHGGYKPSEQEGQVVDPKFKAPVFNFKNPAREFSVAGSRDEYGKWSFYCQEHATLSRLARKAVKL
ncbi:MAG: hypothetical protein R3F55_20010 [Alphaproteobacteria bacterium]